MERTLQVTLKNFVTLTNGKKGPVNVPFGLTPTAILKEMKEVGAKFSLGFNWATELSVEQVEAYIAKDKELYGEVTEKPVEVTVIEPVIVDEPTEELNVDKVDEDNIEIDSKEEKIENVKEESNASTDKQFNKKQFNKNNR